MTSKNDDDQEPPRVGEFPLGELLRSDASQGVPQAERDTQWHEETQSLLSGSMPVGPSPDDTDFDGDAQARIRQADLTDLGVASGRLGHFQLGQLIGRGGMGVVYAGRDLNLDRPLAIKMMRTDVATNAQAAARFTREAQAMASIDHPHVARVYHVDKTPTGAPYIAMELLHGVSLSHYLSSHHLPSLTMTVEIAKQIARGLGAAHAKGLIHRDIKPDNIWLVNTPDQPLTVKILDFGLARPWLAADAEEANLTQSGQIMGSPSYMAPEQARGEATDHRADLFSLGTVMYEMLTGISPFKRPMLTSTLIAIATEDVDFENVDEPTPPALQQIVLRLLEKDPAGRFQSANELVAALDGVQDMLDDPEAMFTPPAALPEEQALVSTVSDQSAETAPLPALEQEDIGRSTESSKASFEPPLATAGTSPSRTIPPRIWRNGWLWLGLAASFSCLAVFRIATNHGTLVVEVSDPAVEAVLKEEGLVIRDTQAGTQWRVDSAAAGRAVRQKLPTGSFDVESSAALSFEVVGPNGESFATSEFKLMRGEEVRLRVFMDPVASNPSTPAPDLAGKPDRAPASNSMPPPTPQPGAPPVASQLPVLSTPPVASQPSAPAAMQPPADGVDRAVAELLVQSGNEVTLSGLGNFRSLESLPDKPFAVTALRILKTMEESDLKTLGQLMQQLEQLEQLYVFDQVVVNDTFWQQASACKLAHIQHFGIPITNACLQSVAKIPTLQQLDLGLYAEANLEGFAALEEHPNLLALYVRSFGSQDSGIGAILATIPNLSGLYLEGATLAEADLQGLAQVSNLRNLQIRKSPLEFTWLQHLAANRQLESVVLKDSVDQTDAETLQQLKQTLPRLELVVRNTEP